jgi:MFS family permease
VRWLVTCEPKADVDAAKPRRFPSEIGRATGIRSGDAVRCLRGRAASGHRPVGVGWGGGAPAIVALIGSLIGIGSLVTNIPSGMLAGRVGERKAMLVAAGIMIAGLLVCLLDHGKGTTSVVVFALGVLLIGCSSSVYMLARQAYLTESVPPLMRARALSTLGGTMRIGIFVGPFLGAAMQHLFGLSGAYFVSLAAISGAAVIVLHVPDLEVTEEHRHASAQVTTSFVIKNYWRLFLSLGLGVLLLSAIRQTRQVVIPLWGHHIGLAPATISLIYGVAGGIDALTFYPAGKVMDLYGRRAVAVPCALILGVSCMLMPLTTGAGTLVLVAMLMGFGNGLGSGIVMTLAADSSPAVGRLTFLGVWREMTDIGLGLGPVILSVVTGIAGLATGLTASGGVGFLAAGALWLWIPRNRNRQRREEEPPEDLPVPFVDAELT